MRPASIFCGFSVLLGADIYRAPGFSNVDCLRIAAAVEAVDPFAFVRRWVGLVFGAEKALQCAPAFVERVASSAGESAF